MNALGFARLLARLLDLLDLFKIPRHSMALGIHGRSFAFTLTCLTLPYLTHTHPHSRTLLRL